MLILFGLSLASTRAYSSKAKQHVVYRCSCSYSFRAQISFTAEMIRWLVSIKIRNRLLPPRIYQVAQKIPYWTNCNFSTSTLYTFRWARVHIDYKSYRKTQGGA